MSDGSIDLNSVESWETSKNFSKILQPIPSSITKAIRTLWKTKLSFGNQAHEECLRSLRLFEKSKVLKTPLYFAAMNLYQDRIQEMKEDHLSEALLRILGPRLFSSLLALIYLQRRLNKLCTSKFWEILSKELVLGMEYGFLIGSAVPNLEKGVGVLIGGLRFAALGTFLVKDEAGFISYRKNFPEEFNLTWEHERWKCDHTQIAANLLKDLAFGTNQFTAAKVLKKSDSWPNDESIDFQIWNAALHWIDGMRLNKHPELSDKSSEMLGMTQMNYTQLKNSADKLSKEGSKFTWMFKSSK